MHTYDFIRPNTNEILPMIVFIHTGGWAENSKEYHRQELEDWSRRGFAYASINYRLAPAHKYLAAIADAQRFIQYAPLNANKLNINPEKIIAVGYSAGGHIAAMLGNIDKYLGEEKNGELDLFVPKVNAVVNIAGPTDLVDLSAFNLNINKKEFFDNLNNVGVSNIPEQLIKRLELIYNFIGNYDYQTWKNASPLHNVTEKSSPCCIIHGQKDELVPFTQALRLYDKLKKMNVLVELHILPGHKHDSMIREKALPGIYKIIDHFMKNIF